MIDDIRVRMTITVGCGCCEEAGSWLTVTPISAGCDSEIPDCVRACYPTALSKARSGTLKITKKAEFTHQTMACESTASIWAARPAPELEADHPQRLVNETRKKKRIASPRNDDQCEYV